MKRCSVAERKLKLDPSDEAERRERAQFQAQLEKERADRIAAEERATTHKDRLRTAHEAVAKVEAELVAAVTEQERLRGERSPVTPTGLPRTPPRISPFEEHFQKLKEGPAQWENAAQARQRDSLNDAQEA